jgi:hypothetical protein
MRFTAVVRLLTSLHRRRPLRLCLIAGVAVSLTAAHAGMAFLYGRSKTWRRIVDTATRSTGNMLLFVAVCGGVPYIVGDQVNLLPDRMCCCTHFVAHILHHACCNPLCCEKRTQRMCCASPTSHSGKAGHEADKSICGKGGE